MNIPTTFALKASFQIFSRGMRTHAPLRFALGAGFDERTGHQPQEKEKVGQKSCFLSVVRHII